MIQCTHCGRLVDRTQSECPNCFKPIAESSQHFDDPSALLSEDAPAESAARPDLLSQREEGGFEDEQFTGPMAPVARFSNAAEAGYFAHELMDRGGIPCSITVEENFDAVCGYWSAKFVLAVPQDQANTAAEVLKQLLEQTEMEERDEKAFVDREASRMQPTSGTLVTDDERLHVEGPLEDSGVNWVPIVLTLAAGSAVFWGIRRLQDQPKVEVPHRPLGAHHDDLWDHLATPSRPWVQPMENGQGQRRLWIDPEAHSAVIQEDADGDGRFETEIRIPRAALER